MSTEAPQAAPGSSSVDPAIELELEKDIQSYSALQEKLPAEEEICEETDKGSDEESDDKNQSAESEDEDVKQVNASSQEEEDLNLHKPSKEDGNNAVPIEEVVSERESDAQEEVVETPSEVCGVDEEKVEDSGVVEEKRSKGELIDVNDSFIEEPVSLLEDKIVETLSESENVTKEVVEGKDSPGDVDDPLEEISSDIDLSSSEEPVSLIEDKTVETLLESENVTEEVVEEGSPGDVDDPLEGVSNDIDLSAKDDVTLQQHSPESIDDGVEDEVSASNNEVFVSKDEAADMNNVDEELFDEATAARVEAENLAEMEANVRQEAMSAEENDPKATFEAAKMALQIAEHRKAEEDKIRAIEQESLEANKSASVPRGNSPARSPSKEPPKELVPPTVEEIPFSELMKRAKDKEKVSLESQAASLEAYKQRKLEQKKKEEENIIAQKEIGEKTVATNDIEKVEESVAQKEVEEKTALTNDTEKVEKIVAQKEVEEKTLSTNDAEKVENIVAREEIKEKIDATTDAEEEKNNIENNSEVSLPSKIEENLVVEKELIIEEQKITNTKIKEDHEQDVISNVTISVEETRRAKERSEELRLEKERIDLAKQKEMEKTAAEMAKKKEADDLVADAKSLDTKAFEMSAAEIRSPKQEVAVGPPPDPTGGCCIIC